MSETVAAHRGEAPRQVGCGVITVSDTRTLETDRGGALLVELLEAAGQRVVCREIVKDEPRFLRHLVSQWAGDSAVDVILLTGGTGISSRDQTVPTIQAMLGSELPGYGELLRMLSFAEVGAAAMLSRAVGGLIGTTVVLTMPGSPAGIRLAMERLILPELGHLVREARR